MAIDVRMPKLSDNMESGVIIRWIKSPGDEVAQGEPLAEVETDKADVELEASASGVLSEIKVPEGQSAEVGAVIAVLEQAGQGAAARPAAKPRAEKADGGDGAQRGDGAQAPAAEPDAEPGRPAPQVRAASTPPPPSRPQPGAARAERPAPASAPPPPEPQPAPARPASGVRASPLAWRLAAEAGIDLSGLHGSGPGGRILKRDVEMAVRGPARRGGAAPASAPAPADDQPAEQPAEREGGAIEPVSRMRLAIARRMSEAKRDIPHFYVTAEIDMTEAMHLRESIRRREAMPGLTVTHLLVRALAIALERHPHVNASWRDGGIEEHPDVNIGIAVAVDDGLVVPVLHRAQTLTLGEIATAASELTEKARQGRFGGDDLTGGTFSLSNVGMLDVEELTAVINPPNAAILAVGAVKERPVVRDGQLAIAKTMRATLSCDHRVLNGLEGGRFLVEVKSILENPVTLLLE